MSPVAETIRVDQTIRVDEVIRGWATAQTRHWVKLRPNRGACAAAWRALNDRRGDVFLFAFADGGVRILDKPQHSRAEIDHAGDGMCWRARQYLGFFRDVAAGRDFAGMLGMSMEDHTVDEGEAPWFAFQKLADSHKLLVPDIDAIRLDFYAGAADALDYAGKADRAVFAGATSGALHSHDSVMDLAAPRVRAAVAFRDVPEVDFRLGHIVQCESEEAEAALREMGFGDGPVPWEAQLASKFLISMDGNGATCSRVALALASHSVLLKYASSYRLYYSEGLVAGYHYVPIARDRDVVGVVRAERASPGLHAGIAANGTRFFEAFLGRRAAMLYTAQVLEAYFGCFRSAAGVAGFDPMDGAELVLRGVAHIAQRADVSFDPPAGVGDAGSGQAIEGFRLTPEGIAPGELEYRAYGPGGRTYVWGVGGSYSGSYGQSQALRGYAVRLRGAAAAQYECRCWGEFAGGESVGPVVDGAACRSRRDAPLETMRVEVRKREGAA